MATNNFNIADSVRQLHLGQVVTVFTTAGGTGGGGYTGAIVGVDSNNLYLLLAPAAAPTGVTGAYGTPGTGGTFGALATIPLNQISSIVQNDL
ncbi:hypothetical protein [Alicyclobacillus vulcanalis]|uniref:Uncharacterized protein n=1 Tax=Alicyclobacillus vulcanalis TaxID=252246 RepID=A0A1N7MVW9_9BACL|nr:hypothetical protein [Alicyclobacillus vulcanalis]SIS90220.1 hypothetical protein SAMN05421799_106162 [Alicyclobacillus vulcanalis]